MNNIKFTKNHGSKASLQMVDFYGYFFKFA